MRSVRAAADQAVRLDLLRAAAAQRIEPCLIGAAALGLALQRCAAAALPRTTRDWDFAIAVQSWREFHDLATRLTAVGGGFRGAAEPHRFVHTLGSILDIVPFGPLESPPGTIRWPGGSVMSTAGFAVLAQHSNVHDLGQGLRLAVGSLAALAGLKVIAYGDRRPAILRDIGDVYHLARSHPWERAGEATIDADAETVLRVGEIGFAHLGAYVLGREMASAFDTASRLRIADLLAEADDLWSDLMEHVVRQNPGSGEESDREIVSACMRALRTGIVGR